ncbi:MAG: alpha/beta hydrolase [Candidatus Loosdrechtia sp.]|uniref:alpha/beta hydrolase n=1 Tax=Candidatus Loosdrechtia sp. TaxID=3101272 RepID=UPI003A704D9C|nr:MAG: alpha/beta fold hydrolase [Candidatus Jettenia sp. AMX2]
MIDTILTDLSLYGSEFTFEGGNPACLLIHGLGSGPVLMREIGEYLCKHGYTARGILLPGHCMDTGGLSLKPYHSWDQKVEAEYLHLKSQYHEVAVIGFSLGALLTLQLAMKYPIKKIILMSTPLFLVRKYLPVHSLIRICRNFSWKIRTWRKKYYMESEIYSGYLYHPINTYFSFEALYEIVMIIETVKSGLKNVQSPALILHSKNDGVAAPASAEYVREYLGSSEKYLVWLERSHHYILCNNGKHVVFNTIRNFLYNPCTTT